MPRKPDSHGEEDAAAVGGPRSQRGREWRRPSEPRRVSMPTEAGSRGQWSSERIPRLPAHHRGPVPVKPHSIATTPIIPGCKANTQRAVSACIDEPRHACCGCTRGLDSVADHVLVHLGVGLFRPSARRPLRSFPGCGYFLARRPPLRSAL